MWSNATFCRNCPCNSYMNRNRPTKFDVSFMIFCVSLFVVAAIFAWFAMSELAFSLEGHEDEAMTLFTKGEFFGLLTILFFGLALLMFGWLVLDPVLLIFSQKRRRKFPVKDDEKL